MGTLTLTLTRILALSLLLVQATEDFMVHLLEDCNLCAIHAKRVTISASLRCHPAICAPAYLVSSCPGRPIKSRTNSPQDRLRSCT